MNEHREKVLFVSESDMLAAVSGIQGIPGDVTICGIHHDYCRRGFSFVLSHPSFRPVLEGQLREEVALRWHDRGQFEVIPFERLGLSHLARDAKAAGD